MSSSLVTGGAGFIGNHVVRGLLAAGHRVRVLDDLSTGKNSNLTDIDSQIELMIGDITNPDNCRRAMEGVETVYHLAARASVPRSIDNPRETHTVNVTGTLNLLEAARQFHVKRFVYSASSSAYGDTPELPKRESMKDHPKSPYAVSKLAGEQYCSAFAVCYGMQTVSLRYFNVFGPRQDPHSAYAAVIPAFVTRMLRSERPVVYGDGEQTRDFCYIDNVVQANLLAGSAARLQGEVVNIGCAERTSLNDVIRVINQELGTNVQPDYQPARAGDVRDSQAAIDEAARVLGYKPKVYFADGIKRSIAWYREHAAEFASR